MCYFSHPCMSFPIFPEPFFLFFFVFFWPCCSLFFLLLTCWWHGKIGSREGNQSQQTTRPQFLCPVIRVRNRCAIIRRWRYYNSESEGGLKAHLNKRRALLIAKPGHRFIFISNIMSFLTVAGLKNWERSFVKHKEVRLSHVNVTAGLQKLKQEMSHSLRSPLTFHAGKCYTKANFKDKENIFNPEPSLWGIHES